MSVVLNFLSLRGVFGSYDDAVFGLVLIGIMLFAPEGFLKVTILAKINRDFKKLLRRTPFSQRRRADTNPLKSNGENE